MDFKYDKLLLSREQQIAFDKYFNGYNIFITGPGGSGKSLLIKQIYNHSINCGKVIKITAMTGCASLLLECNAKTIHSWAGIGTGNFNGSIDKLIKRIRGNKRILNNWLKTEILVIDEISMLSLKLFELLNNIAQKIRHNNYPFGGIQIIMSGDFYQLPPIGNNDDIQSKQFCFESDLWNIIFSYDCQIELVKIFRQNDDNFAKILNQVREGKIKKSSNNILNSLVGREIDINLFSEPTKLYPTKNSVEYINNFKLNNLKTEIKEFKMKYCISPEIKKKLSNNIIDYEFKLLNNNLLCEKELKLKIGAQVMSIININQSTYKKKIEGLDKSNWFIKNNDIMDNDNDNLLICNGSNGIIKNFCPITGFPLVKFNNNIEMIITPHSWQSENYSGLSISQIPLILSWALTIHKSQGATLDCAEIDIGSGIFECGQSYVALSRVKNLNGLYLTSYDVSKIKINKKVKEFYENLRNKQK
jgi:ATP-dependent DNA helicase PIF1